MRVNVKSIIKALLILIFLTVLPLYGLQLMPGEFFKLFTMQGFDIAGLVNKIALIGVVMAALVLLRGHVQKPSGTHLALATVWKVFLLYIVFFALGLGRPETLGLAVLGGEAGGASNLVIFDLRLFGALATVIVALMIIRSVIEFRQIKSKLGVQEPEGGERTQ